MKINLSFCGYDYLRKSLEEIVNDDYYSNEFDVDGTPKELGLENKKSNDFFRDNELYSTETDTLDSGYRKYSYDDVETTVKSKPKNRPVNYDSRPYAFDTDLHYCMKSKPIHREKFLHLILNDVRFSSANAAINSDCDFDDVVKIIETSTLLDKKGRINFDKSMLNDGCKLLRKKYPVETVLEYLNLSKFKNLYIGEYYEPRLFNFVVQHPEHTDDVLLKYDENYKRFDFGAIDKILELEKCCNDKNLANEILDNCRVLDPYGTRLTNNDLYNVAREFLFANDNKWNDVCSKILKNLKSYSPNSRSEIVDLRQCEQIKRAVQSGISFDTILKIFF